jgi:hypothetical protein
MVQGRMENGLVDKVVNSYEFNLLGFKYVNSQLLKSNVFMRVSRI